MALSSIDESVDQPAPLKPSQDQRKLKSRNKERSSSLPSQQHLHDELPTLSHSMTSARAIPLLICSVGNPGGAYANTLHSAGHTVLNRLAEYLGHGSFQKDRTMGNGLVSTGSNTSWTLWQSTSYMNDSGKGVKAAWKSWIRSIPDGEGKLVIVHDELEKALGAVSLRTAQGASAKGHNGLKSIISEMGGGVPFSRIGIGIGRPVSRESDDVARYVLKKMSPMERAKMDGCINEVVAKLQQLEKG